MSKELFNEVIKTNDIHFRGIQIGENIENVINIEGTPTEEKRYSNPFLSYFYEVGEMEEIKVYYNFLEDSNEVIEIKLFFISYPDYYWKNEGGEDYTEFTNLLVNNAIQKYSEAFQSTVNEIINHFKVLFNEEPTISTTDQVYNLPYQNYKSNAWVFKDKYRLSVTTYIDDLIDTNVKNTMIVWLRSF